MNACNADLLFEDDCDFNLFFDMDLNRFIDEFGSVINDMHELFYPWEIIYAKKEASLYGFCVLTSKTREVVGLFFPDDWSF